MVALQVRRELADFGDSIESRLRLVFVKLLSLCTTRERDL